ncbi:four-carbon acid sugar kinase family protein [Aestuariibaculum sp. YM273]|uniref:four-carbon acid sugar kinase family protein n=1 Tax=Aestuariibaculum sp. YM273 TaxID=3070659 RepID=UPI0027DB7056|nr:four-carbon acid sugar kinase family protein [Aestuariibaculum sp. YM273]WMI64871.1 four-carbon acid sugar kinase family protein [Aestuariibaculum sp. YM273]
MQNNNKILLAYYGDDFTGSTDALEFLSRAGIKTVLFLELPTPEMLGQFSGLEAVGVAGMTRSMTPDEMTEELLQAFETLKTLNPKHVHYKVCSTFDSSPEIGNIGTAIDCGIQIFKNQFTPVLVAMPNLGRYSAFGNLYAKMGIGSQGDIYRLDRHPSMSKHPITPVNESDLRVHLSKQTNQSMGLIDLIDLGKPVDEIKSKLQAEIKEHPIVFFDAMYEEQMQIIGEVIDNRVVEGESLFSVGSSGIEKALGDFWEKQGLLSKRTNWRDLEESHPILVLSGSVSPITANQIKYALAEGFEQVEVTADALENPEVEQEFIEKYQTRIINYLKAGKSVILHTANGPEDNRVEKTKAFFQNIGLDELTIRSQTAKRFGKILGQSALGALKEVPVKRLVIAGGDTSSYVARVLGIKAVEMIAPVFTGAPLCKAFAPDSPVDQIEVNLKGGQVGDETYFVALQRGKITN